MTVSDWFNPGEKLYSLPDSKTASTVIFYRYCGDPGSLYTWFIGYDMDSHVDGEFRSEDYRRWSDIPGNRGKKVAAEDTNSNMSEGEVRVTSSTGGQKGSKLARFDLIPEDSLWKLAESYGINLDKYPLNPETGLENWRHGYNWSLSYAAMERHLNQSKSGETFDLDNGVNHLVSVAWHAFTLLHYMDREDLQHFDDRQSTLLKKYLEDKEND